MWARGKETSRLESYRDGLKVSQISAFLLDLNNQLRKAMSGVVSALAKTSARLRDILGVNLRKEKKIISASRARDQ